MIWEAGCGISTGSVDGVQDRMNFRKRTNPPSNEVQLIDEKRCKGSFPCTFFQLWIKRVGSVPTFLPDQASGKITILRDLGGVQFVHVSTGVYDDDEPFVILLYIVFLVGDGIIGAKRGRSTGR